MSNLYKFIIKSAKLNRGDTLKIYTEYRNGILFVRLSGSLTKNTFAKLNNKVTRMVNDIGIRNVVLNIEKLNKIDFKGVDSLLYNCERIKKSEGRIFLCGNNDSINNVLRRRHVFNYINEISNELCAMHLMKG